LYKGCVFVLFTEVMGSNTSVPSTVAKASTPAVDQDG